MGRLKTHLWGGGCDPTPAPGGGGRALDPTPSDFSLGVRPKVCFGCFSLFWRFCPQIISAFDLDLAGNFLFILTHFFYTKMRATVLDFLLSFFKPFCLKNINDFSKKSILLTYQFSSIKSLIYTFQIAIFFWLKSSWFGRDLYITKLAFCLRPFPFFQSIILKKFDFLHPFYIKMPALYFDNDPNPQNYVNLVPGWTPKNMVVDSHLM